MQPYIIVLIVLAAVLCFICIIAAVSDNFAFGRRYGKNPILRYFTAEDFSLNTKNVEIKRGKTHLKGFLYSKEDVPQSDKLVIFVHGMGAGQVEYTTEIAYFCNKGYTVLALDSRGCNYSDGKSIVGMYEGVKTCVAAIDYARAADGLKDKKIILVGHSWGGYSVLCASKERKVEKVVAISAPDTPSKTVKYAAGKMIGRPLAAILRPFWWLINIFKFGFKGNMSAAKCAKKSATPTLLIHGDNDKIVPPECAVFYHADGENITKLLSSGKAHNPYNTAEAEKLLAELSKNLSGKKSAEERKAFVESFDFNKVTEEDAEVMQSIVNFIEGQAC